MIDADLGPAVALHPHRAVGVCYGGVAAAVLTVIWFAVVAALDSGRLVMASITALGGLGVTAFLAVLALALLIPGLEVAVTGVGSREFVLLVASTPQAARRLTPQARAEVARLLGLEDA